MYCYCQNQMAFGETIRSSPQRCSMKKGVFRNFAKFTGKHLCQSLFFNKVDGLGIFHSVNLFRKKYLANSFLSKLEIFCLNQAKYS